MTTATDNPVGYRHPYMTPKQAKWLFDLINTRIGDSDPDLLNRWKQVYFSIRTRQGFETAINELRVKPVLAHKVPEVATEPGLYRNPSDGMIYRLAIDKQGHRSVSVYSQKSIARRLLTTGQIVKKGTWKKLRPYQSRILLNNRVGGDTLLAEWQMTDADKIEYVTGICNFCYRGLIDGRSVKYNYGPECAAKRGLPWGE